MVHSILSKLFLLFQVTLRNIIFSAAVFGIFALATMPVIRSVQGSIAIPVAQAKGLHFGSLPTAKIVLPTAQSPDYDLDKLAHAVAFAETGECRDGTATKRNNCFGLMVWDKNGNRSPRYFKSQADSFKEFKRVWATYYGRFPDAKLAQRWSGNDHPTEWLHNVVTYYNSHTSGDL